jgi:hypothetical protein
VLWAVAWRATPTVSAQPIPEGPPTAASLHLHAREGQLKCITTCTTTCINQQKEEEASDGGGEAATPTSPAAQEQLDDDTPPAPTISAELIAEDAAAWAVFGSPKATPLARRVAFRDPLLAGPSCPESPDAEPFTFPSPPAGDVSHAGRRGRASRGVRVVCVSRETMESKGWRVDIGIFKGRERAKFIIYMLCVCCLQGGVLPPWLQVSDTVVETPSASVE